MKSTTTHRFHFRYPLRQKTVRDLNVVFEHLGELEVEASGRDLSSLPGLDIFDRFSVEVEAVRWKGTDIRPVLEVAGMMEAIIEAAVRQFAALQETGWNKAA